MAEYKVNKRPMFDTSDDEKEQEDIELLNWLKKYGLTKYEFALKENQIGYHMIQLFDDEDAKELAEMIGLKGFHVKIFVKAVMHIRTGKYPPKAVIAAPAESKQPEDKWEMLRAKRKKQGLQGAVHLKSDRIDDVIGGKTKTMIFIGQTGAGKTTLINSMCNYLNCVAYKEPFRYKLIMESKDKTIVKDTTKSQTREITKYYLNKLPGVEYAYGLNIVDTPGFGDTEGPEQDLKIRSKFKEFFNQIDSVDGIYFVVKASDTRLGATQKYIFNMVLDLFGDNVKGNIFILFTFSDGADPPALKAVKKMDVPFTKEFRINNSGFGLSGSKNRTHEMFFSLGMEQFKEIFDTLSRVEPKSIANSLQTLKEREAITNWLTSIRDAVQLALENIETTKRLKLECEQNSVEINNNQEYEFDDIIYQERRQKTDYYNIGCADCNVICYERASMEPIDKEKELPKSSVFDADTGTCTVCKDRCPHTRHSVVMYILVKEKKVVKRRRSEMFQKYSKARQKVASAEELIARMKQDIKTQDYKVRKAIKMMKESVNRLQKIALRKKVLSDDEYYDTLISMEQSERKEGWQKRCESLTKMKEDKATFVAIMQDPDKEFGLLAGLDMDEIEDDDKEYEEGLGIETPRVSANPSPKVSGIPSPGGLAPEESTTQYNVNLFGYTIFSFSATNN